MKTWIVTGGAASGKSTFARLLADLGEGTLLYSSDESVHRLLGKAEIAALLAKEFGTQILDEKKFVDRKRLRAAVFDGGDEEKRKRLEGILHPLVRRDFEEVKATAAAGKKTQLLIAEVPLFYESAHDYQADLVIVVAVGPRMQLERLTGQRGLDPETAERIRSAQWPLSRKLEAAPKVIWNEGSAELLKLQAQLLLQQLDSENG